MLGATGSKIEPLNMYLLIVSEIKIKTPYFTVNSVVLRIGPEASPGKRDGPEV